jgi:hypothetical protein
MIGWQLPLPEVLFQDLTGRAEENHEKPESECLVPWLRFEPSTSLHKNPKHFL